MTITNQSNITEWSKYSQEEIENFGEEGDKTRRDLLNPILFNLLGDVKDKTVLDAGCGTGYLSRKLAKLGAVVTGIEPAQTSFAYIIDREKKEKLGITYLQEDLSQLNKFTEEFDLVISNMVFMDIPEYETAIKNCVKALKKGGIFIFSISHPCFPGSDQDWLRQKHVEISNYFDAPPEKNKYGSSFNRPIQNYLNLILDSGCTIQKVVEPQASEKLVEKDPQWERNHFVPQFLLVKARKDKTIRI